MRWTREKKATGLYGVVQGYRTWTLKEEDYGLGMVLDGYKVMLFAYGSCGDGHINIILAKQFETEIEAKDVLKNISIRLKSHHQKGTKSPFNESITSRLNWGSIFQPK